MTPRRLVRAGVTVAVLVLGACSSGGEDPDAPSPPGTTGSPVPPSPPGTTESPAASTPSPLSDEQVVQVLQEMDTALQSGDVEAYLQHVAPGLADQQRAWFDAVQAVPMDVRQLRLDGVVSRNDVEGTTTHVGLRHQVTGADPVPVLEQYRWVFATGEDGRVRLVSSQGRNGELYGYPQVWDDGEPVAVIEGHSVLLLAPESHREQTELLLDTLDLAAERALEELPWAAADRELVVVNLVDADLLASLGEHPDNTAAVQLMARSAESIPWDAPRLTASSPPVQGRVLLDVDAATADLEEFGPSPGGHTMLRQMVAHVGLYGQDNGLWPQDWLLDGVPWWWSAAQDPPYLDDLHLLVADHHLVEGPPSGLPAAPFRGDPPSAYDSFAAASLSLALYLAQAHGDAALIDLAGRLMVLDRRYDEAAIEQAYLAALGVGQEEVLEGWARWAEELADERGTFPATEQG